MPAEHGPLEGLRIVDLTSVFMGPYCTVVLADLGADVVKVEPPEGDITRRIGPSHTGRMGPVFLAANRNKRSVVLNLKQDAARRALDHVIAGADAVVHNFRPAAAKRLRLSYEDVCGVRPDVVYCAMYGYGENGPYRGRPAYDDTIQAVSGLASLAEPFAGEPQYSGTVAADKTVGLAAAVAILAAMLHRQRTGEGQSVDIAMFETMASFVLVEHLYGATFEPPLDTAGYPRALSPGRRPYATSDGHLSVMLYTNRHWRDFFELAGRRDMADDARLADIGARTTHIDDLYRLVGEIIVTRTTEEWLKELGAADIPCAPVLRPADLLTDPHLAATGFFAEVEHPTEGRIRTVPFPARLGRTPTAYTRPAPGLGEHTHEVLAEAGLAEGEITELEEQHG